MSFVFGTAAGTAAVFAVLAYLFSLFQVRTSSPVVEISASRYDFYGALVTFVVEFIVNFMFFMWWMPVFNGGGWVPWILANLVVTGLATWGFDALEGNISSGKKIRDWRRSDFDVNWPAPITWLCLIGFVGLLIVSAFKGGFFNAYGQDRATKLASVARVETPKDAEYRQQASNQIADTTPSKGGTPTTSNSNGYPATNQNHVPIVLLPAARYKAESALGEYGLSSFYDIDKAEESIVAGKLVWVFDLHPLYNWKQMFQSKPVHNSITVSAEDPDAKPVLHNQEFNFYPGGRYGRSLERALYQLFPNDFIDGLSPEMDDSEHVFYTASLNRNDIRWGTSATPRRAVVFDPTTGDYHVYRLATATDPGDLPAWVDRVIAPDTAQAMMTWYGRWGAGPQKAPYSWSGESPNNRTQPAGNANLVFTNEGPAYQFLMVGYNIDTGARPNAAALNIVLMDTRTGAIRVYPGSGIQIESSLKAIFHNLTTQGVAKGVPDNAAVYLIHGRWVWVGGLISEDKLGTEDAVPFAGIGISDAVDGTTATAIVSNTWGDALNKLDSLPPSSTADKTATKQAQEVTVVIAEAEPLTDGGLTKVTFKAEGDKIHIYVGPATQSQPGTLERLYIHTGAKVTIRYTDDGSTYRQIQSITELAPAA